MRFLHRLGLGTLLAMLLIGVLPVSGQDIPERISLTAGSILEIGIDTKLHRPEFSWILTKEREFIAAQRSKFFQTRPTIPGTYTLDVSIQNEEHTLSEFRTFAIDVTEAGMLPMIPILGSGSAMPIVQFDPPESSRSISLNPQGGILKIDASMSTGIDRFDIDLDGSKDSNDDGNPLNDADNNGSASQQSGGPLYYFFLPSNEPRIIGLTMIDRQNTPMQSQYSIGFTGRSSGGPIVPQGGSIEISSQIQNLAVRFSADVNPLLLSGRSVLYEWDFGDHQKSLLKNPVHRYSAPGTYTVQLAIRDLQNGQIVYGGTTQVNLTETTEPIPEEPDPSEGGSTFGTYLKIGTIFIGLLALGLIAYFVLRKIKDVTSGRIQKKLEEVEGKLFDPSKKPDVLAAPAPLVLKKESPPPIVAQKTEQAKQEVVDREKSQTEFKAAKEQPTADQNGPVPAWLKPVTPEAKPAVQTAPPPAPKPPEPQQKPQTPAPIVPPKPPAPVAPPSPPPSQSAPQPMPVAPPTTPPTVTKPAAPTPPIQTTTVSNATIEPRTIPATPESKVLTPAEREAERKRKKRQRYRHNKRLREKESKDVAPAMPTLNQEQENDPNAPIAIIRADSLDDTKKS